MSQTALTSPETTEELTMIGAVNSAMAVAMEVDPRVILLGEDIADAMGGGVMKATKGLSTRFGEDRVRATPISEQAIVGTALGLSLGGYRPVAEIMFADFLTECMDQLVNHVAKSRYMSGGHSPAPIVVRTTMGVRRFGAQHAQALEAWFMHTPGIKVVVPSNPADAKGLLLSAIFDDDPCLFIESMDMAFTTKGQVPGGDHRVPLGEAAVVREGQDLTIVTYGAEVHLAVAAADQLASEISVEVIDLRTLVPLDLRTILTSVAKTRGALVVHAATQFCGPGAEIASQISSELFGELRAPVARLGSVYAPLAFAPALEPMPTTDSIIDAARRVSRASSGDM